MWFGNEVPHPKWKERCQEGGQDQRMKTGRRRYSVVRVGGHVGRSDCGVSTEDKKLAAEILKGQQTEVVKRSREGN